MNVDRIAEAYLAVAHEVLSALRADILEAAEDIVRRLRDGHKIMLCGNGGSAADAQHFAAELVNRFLIDRAPYAAIALTTDTSILTAIGNDVGYDDVFAKQVLALGRPGDLLVAISTSGNAKSVLRAVDAARAAGVATLAMTGGDGGRLAARADRVLLVSSTRQTPRIQEGHCLMMHMICEQVEERLVAIGGADAATTATE